MKILINASTLVVGGGVQVARNLIINTFDNQNHDFYYIVSKELYEQLGDGFMDKGFSVIKISPAKRIKGIKSRKMIKSIEKTFLPDIVYSVGAPSYVSFINPEVLRLTNSWLFGNYKLPLSTYPGIKKYKTLFILFVQRLYIKKRHYIITQTNVAKEEISSSLKISKERIFVIPNVYSSIFDVNIKNTKETSNKVRIFCFAAPYNHKNIDIIPELIHYLVKKGMTNFEFLVTIPSDFNPKWQEKFYQKCNNLNVGDFIKNLGKIDFKKAPEIYQQSDILFLPTLFETFSVTYLEAMASGVPIVTTDLPFAREVCDKAAIYFKPKDPKNAAERIFEIIMNKDLKESLFLSGKERIKTFAKEDEIYTKHIEVLETIYKEIK